MAEAAIKPCASYRGVRVSSSLAFRLNHVSRRKRVLANRCWVSKSVQLLSSSITRVDYDQRIHAVYSVGRAMSDHALARWMNAFAAHVPDRRPLAWLDLGSGTGRLAPSLAEAFGGPVYGVEPSDRMRDQAASINAHPNVVYGPGSAKSIPLSDSSVDAALLSFVWHHVDDKSAAAAELRRVVRPGGKVFVRTNLADKMPDLWWFPWIPEAREADRKMYQPLRDVVANFGRAGWSLSTLDEVSWISASSRREDFERLKLRAVALFDQLADQVIEAGFAKIEADLPSLEDDEVVETNALLVFE